MVRARIYTGAPLEPRYGYCRAVRAGNLVFVTGTVALTPDGTPLAPGDHAAQAARALEIVAAALVDPAFVVEIEADAVVG